MTRKWLGWAAMVRATSTRIQKRGNHGRSRDRSPFHNDPGVLIEIGARGVHVRRSEASPHDHPHVFLDMGDAAEIICPYCSTLYRHDPTLDPHADGPRPAPDPGGLTERSAGAGASSAQYRHRGRRHRRSDRGARARRQGLSHCAARPGRQAGSDRRRHPAFPNATRVLIGPVSASGCALTVVVARGGERSRPRTTARSPACRSARPPRPATAPYWVIHRGDLQAALLDAALAHHDIVLTLGGRDRRLRYLHAKASRASPAGRRVEADAARVADQRRRPVVGAALPGSGNRCADSASRTARARIPARCGRADGSVHPPVHLWLGRGSHLVHYPVKGGAPRLTLSRSSTTHGPSTGWSTVGDGEESCWRDFSRWLGALPVRDFWRCRPSGAKWALSDVPRRSASRARPVTLLGDAAHPMLPFLAQGAAMAIEDAAVLARRARRDAGRSACGAALRAGARPRCAARRAVRRATTPPTMGAGLSSPMGRGQRPLARTTIDL